MLSAVFIFTQKGEAIISRLYRHDLRRSITEAFRVQVITNPDVRAPVITVGNTSYLHVRHENLYIMAVTRHNANAVLVFEFLERFVAVCERAFGKLDEASVKQNFMLVYELMDEILDFGYPQTTEFDILKRHISGEKVVSVGSRRRGGETQTITDQATGATPWRGTGIKYRRNECFLDLIENVNLIVSSSGAVLRQDVSGVIKLRVSLSGMPECSLGLSDQVVLRRRDTREDAGDDFAEDEDAVAGTTGSVVLQDCQFHQCAQLSKLHMDKVIQFVPPDGDFELMRYRVTDNIQVPFKVFPIVTEVGRSRVEYSIGVKSMFPRKLVASATITIPVPQTATKVNITRTSIGRSRYEPSQNAIVWRTNRFTGQSDQVIVAAADLMPDTLKSHWTRPPIMMDFQLLLNTASGLTVRFLKITERSSNSYKPVKWLRYTTRAGNYEIRF